MEAWRGTGLVFAGLVLAVATTLLVLIPGLVEATNQMSGKVPEWINQIESTFGISIDGGKPPPQIQADFTPARSTGSATTPRKCWASAVTCQPCVPVLHCRDVHVLRRRRCPPTAAASLLRQLPPARQQRAGWAWDTAITQTGGYFYSRILLMVINGSLFFIVMLLVGVDWSIALPLAIFEGFVAEFIPAVGTYIGAAIPIIVTLALVGVGAALSCCVWTLVYQQFENYLLSPRISARTMELNGGRGLRRRTGRRRDRRTDGRVHGPAHRRA